MRTGLAVLHVSLVIGSRGHIHSRFLLSLQSRHQVELALAGTQSHIWPSWPGQLLVADQLSLPVGRSSAVGISDAVGCQ